MAALPKLMVADTSVAQSQVQAALGQVASLAGYRGLQRKTVSAKRSGGKADHDSNQRRCLTVASAGYELAFVERDIGFEPTTFSLGKRKRPFRAVTGRAK